MVEKIKNNQAEIRRHIDEMNRRLDQVESVTVKRELANLSNEALSFIIHNTIKSTFDELKNMLREVRR